MAEKLFKLSKYHNDCYCTRGKGKPIIAKFDASAGGTGIGMSNTRMACPLCGHIRHFRIDTWWGGSFKDSENIFLDSAKKKKFKVADAVDLTKTLLTEHIKTLDNEVRNKTNSLKMAEKHAKIARDVLNRVLKEGQKPAKKEKGKKKNG